MKIRLLTAASRAQTSRVARRTWLAVLVLAGWWTGVSAMAAQTRPILINGHEAHPTRILAEFKDDVVVTASADTLDQLGSKIEWQARLVPGLVLLDDTTASAAAGASAPDDDTARTRLLNRINALKLSGLFKYVEPDYIVRLDLTPTDQSFVDGTLWGLRNTGQLGGVPGADVAATAAWDVTTGSTNVIVAVIDTGIRYTHYDLTNQMWRNPGEIAGNGIDDDTNGYVDDIHGINAINDTGDPMDLDDHGTHVAGTIGAAANDGNRHVGVTWKVRLMACRFLGGAGGSTANGIKCIDYAVANGARVLNNSWGGGGYSQALYNAIDRARQAGVLFVGSAGNFGMDNDANPHYPSSYPLDNIVAVAAIDRYNTLANFSHYGLTSVDLGAPGVDIYSSTSGSDTDYQTFDGTSMASPHVSGVAALILSLYPSADLSELTGRLYGGVVPVPSLNGRTVTGGRVNAYNALTLTGSGVLQMSVTPPSGSFILQSSAQPIYVKVTDLFGVNTATVNGEVVGVTNLVFANNGQPPDAIANDNIYTAVFQVPASTGSVTMKLTATATNKFGATNEYYYTILPPPPNDYFTNSTKVPAAGEVYFANNRFATMETGEPKHAGVNSVVASLWWSYSAASDTNLFVDTTGSTIDTVLAVYTGTAVTSLQALASANDVGKRKQAYLTVPVQSGAAYRIAVASANTNSLGSIQLRVAPGGERDSTPPAVYIASPLSGLSVSNQVITVTGTALDPSPNVSGVSEVFMSVNGGIAVSAVGTTNWSAPALLQAGVNTLRVSSVDAAGNSSPTVTIQVHYLPNDPANDVFANALPLTATPERVEAYSTNATKEVSEPDHAGNAGGKSVWWQYQPPGDGVLVLNTTNSSFDTLLALYTGTIVTNLTQIAANDDATGSTGGFSEIVQAVRANTLYHIAVDGYDGVSGHVSLNYSFTPATVFRLTVTASAGGSVLPASGDFADNSAITLTATPAANYTFSAWSGDVVSSVNPLPITIHSDMSLTANFEPIRSTDGFETGDLLKLPWTTAGNTPWFVTNQMTFKLTNVSLGSFTVEVGGPAYQWFYIQASTDLTTWQTISTNQFVGTPVTFTDPAAPGYTWRYYRVVSVGQCIACAARSGSMTNNLVSQQVSSLILTTNVQVGSASFDYRVSSEPNYDYLKFSLDGVELQRWSGEVGWATFVFPLTSGAHTLRWDYVKDPTDSSGLDAALIDNLNLPVGPP